MTEEELAKQRWKEHVGVGQPAIQRHLDRAGDTKDVLIKREDNGKLSGKQTYHKDGRVDATIIAPTIIKNLVTGEVTSS